jgi:16S rRNA (adenine1518-N6/adenine1519-N6)-dimethyltransferase
MELFAKKSLGQHFLNSTHVLEQIIAASKIQKGRPEGRGDGAENVLEIGPGTGILTQKLLESGARVTAVEKDHRAIEVLEKKFTEELKTGQLSLISGDILELRQRDSNGNSAASAFSLISTPYALVANIPYYITGAILESFLEHEPRPSRMVLLVQKEVAERIVARGKTEDKGKESILSISVKAFGTPRIIAKVPRGAFTPPPTVDSAIISIEHISDEPFRQKGVAISRFFEIVKAGFAHKRKYLIRNLEAILGKDGSEKLDAAWKTLGLDTKMRSEDVSVDQWFEIARFL